MKGMGSFGAEALRTLPRETFLKPSLWRMSSYCAMLLVLMEM